MEKQNRGNQRPCDAIGRYAGASKVRLFEDVLDLFSYTSGFVAAALGGAKSTGAALRDESYVRRWLPELEHPAGSIHTGGAVRGHIAPLATEPLQLGRRKLGVWQAAFNKTLIRPLSPMQAKPQIPGSQTAGRWQLQQDNT
ncbi:unnamed protein product [Durusdinium trenchii]|uniref:Uncharacterized protein n=1 Tax=Durusdinium trenchii TaxID=1381693 RepID=A0ABP0IKI8_9DINO